MAQGSVQLIGVDAKQRRHGRQRRRIGQTGLVALRFEFRISLWNKKTIHTNANDVVKKQSKCSNLICIVVPDAERPLRFSRWYPLMGRRNLRRGKRTKRFCNQSGRWWNQLWPRLLGAKSGKMSGHVSAATWPPHYPELQTTTLSMRKSERQIRETIEKLRHGRKTRKGRDLLMTEHANDTP